MSPTTIPELSTMLQTLLMEEATRLGRASGFIQRERKLNGASFAQSLVFGWQANPQASLEELCQSAAICGVQISPQGLQERLNSPRAAWFMQQLLEHSLSYLVTAAPVALPGLARFTGIYVQDSTTISLPPSFIAQWRASGNQHVPRAGLKVQTVFNYQDGRLQVRLAPAVAHDCSLQTTALPAGSLRLADVGYFKVSVFESLNHQSVWWLTRLPASVRVWQDEQLLPLATWLQQSASSTGVDQPVQLTSHRLACRLLAYRVPPEVAARRRAEVEADARRRSHRVRPETLALCDWLVLATNLPPEALTLTEASVLLRLRWQIELLFKLWKQTLALDTWRSQQPGRILTEVFAKLLLAVIQHWLVLVGCWGETDRSVVKAALTLRKHALHLAAVLPHFPTLVAALQTILPTLKRCTIQKRKARPATFQLLERAFA